MMRALKISVNAYYQLTKPGIIRGNAITATAGFFLASRDDIELALLLIMLAGISLVIASACVFNNYIDRDIDKLMVRTKKRAFVEKLISPASGLLFGAVLGLAGVYLLLAYINPLTASIATFGFLAYVFLYGYAKRKTVHGTLVGSISGAVPPVVGYCSVTNNIDAAAVLLFLILVAWQMPHFYAIAIYRQKDYEAAKIPVLPIVAGHHKTKMQILAYIFMFTLAAMLLTYYGYMSYFYLVAALSLGAAWFWKGLRGFESQNDEKWARGMFGFSILVITALCVFMSLDATLL